MFIYLLLLNAAYLGYASNMVLWPITPSFGLKFIPQIIVEFVFSFLRVLVLKQSI